jgi:mono/diheme cytochrome c family protein
MYVTEKKIIAALTLSLICLPPLPAQDVVTYTKDISPIIYNNCTICHRPGEIGPFALTSFEEVRDEAYTILSVTRKGYMPPWMPNREFSKFKLLGERGLTDQEIKTIAQWVEAGMPEGDPAIEAPMPKFAKGSALGNPDLTLRADEPYKIKGSNEDEYRVFVLPTGLSEDRDLVGVEFRPGNRAILHHALLAFDTTGQAREVDASDPLVGYEVFGGFGIPVSPQAQLPGYTPGAVPLRLPKGVGIKLPAGADILMQTHYAPWPVRDSDQSGVNLFFADEPVERYLKTRQLMPFDLVEEDTLQPPELNLLERLDVIRELVDEFGQNGFGGAGNSGDVAERLGDGFGGRLEGWSLFKLPPDEVSRFHGLWKVEEDISLISIYPHMHLLGKGWEIYAIDPEGNRENLLKIDSWDFNWQGDYPLPKYLKIDKGSTIHAIATYDNTAANPLNPRMPPQASGWGGKTTDEMYLLGFNYVDYREGDENTSLDNLDSKASKDLPSLQIRQNSDQTYSLIYESLPDSCKIECSDDLLNWSPYSQPTYSSKNYGYTVMPIVANGNQHQYFRVSANP